MMRILLAIIIFIFISVVPVFSQNEITGSISMSNGEKIPGAVVKIMNGKKISGYGKTDKSGEFKIKISGERPDTLELVADCIGFEQLKQPLLKNTNQVKLVMNETTRMLREVTVVAPNIRHRGDTMRYRLNAFTGKSDLTLEDGLKKLPGVEVGETGKISYQGKEISDFYVENQQLVGANYGLVTKNMPAEYVTDVEFIDNHQAAAIDKGKMSDNVALNVKLSNKAKFKPVGTAEALSGAQKNRFIYRAGATGMMFSPKFQTMLTLKAGNYGKQNSVYIDQYNTRVNNYAASAIGALTGANPPLAQDIYAKENDLSGNLNFLKMFSPSKTLRVNLNYNYDKTRNHYYQSSIYAVEGESIEFSESGDPSHMSHLPFLNVNYTLNNPDLYVKNDFLSKLEITTNEFNLISDKRYYKQHQKIRALNFSDNFSWRKKFGSKTYSFISGVSYLITPVVSLNISSRDYFQAQQSASGHTLYWTGRTSFDWRKGNSIWTLPFTADFSSTRLLTDLDILIYPQGANNVASAEANINISPSYEFSSRDRRLQLNASIPVNLQLFNAQNRLSEAKSKIRRVIVNPSLRINYNPDSKIKISFFSGIHHSNGDVLDLLSNDIMTDFRNIKTSSGIIGMTTDFNANFKLAYNNAVDMFFGDLSANYSHSKRNTINSLFISDEEIEQATLFFDNYSDNFSSSAMLSKDFYKAGIKISVRGNFFWSKNHTYQQDRLITSFATSYSLAPKINVSPVRFFELSYSSVLGKTFTRFDRSRSGIFSMNNDVHLSFYPAEGWDIFGETSILRKELNDGSYKDFAILNAGVTWKLKKYRFTLRADNILNTLNYTYSIFNGINIYNYDFALSGLTVYLKFSLTI